MTRTFLGTIRPRTDRGGLFSFNLIGGDPPLAGIAHANACWRVVQCLGRITQHDHGKHVYLVGNVVQVENAAQKRERERP